MFSTYFKSLSPSDKHCYAKKLTLDSGIVVLCVHTAAGESVKIRSGRSANDAVERFVDALTIERLVLNLKEPKRKQAC